MKTYYLAYSLNYTIETTNGITIEIELRVNYIPGEREVRYTKNGDGYPGSPPEVEVIGVDVLFVENNSGEEIRVRPDWRPLLDNYVNDWIDAATHQIYDDTCHSIADSEEDYR